MSDPEAQQNLERIEQEINNLEESYSVAYKSIRQYIYQ
jgi:DNA-binding ferritin-like protein (Dps family)